MPCIPTLFHTLVKDDQFLDNRVLFGQGGHKAKQQQVYVYTKTDEPGVGKSDVGHNEHFAPSHPVLKLPLGWR